MGSLVAELAEKLSSATNNLDFDEQTLFINTSADTVGIGTNAPAAKLDVRGTMQVGVNDTGHDVIFYGATSGAKFWWDESVDTLVVAEGVLAGLTTGDFSMQSTARASVSNCTYSFKDDPDTGMIRTAANALALVTAATNRIQIIADGKVGIGTSAPAALLDVQGTFQVGKMDTGYNIYIFGDTDERYLHWQPSNDTLTFKDSTTLGIGSADDMKLYHDGSHSFITNAVGTLNIATLTSGIAVLIGHGTSEVTIAENLTVAGTTALTGVVSPATHVDMPDSAIIKLGTGDDLQLYHNGSHSYINNSTGSFILNTTSGELELGTGTSGIAVKIGHTTSETTIKDNATITGTLTQTGIATFAARVAIGVADATYAAATADDLVIRTTGGANGGITIATPQGNIFFSDATSGAGQYAGGIQYTHSSNNMAIYTAGVANFNIASTGVVTFTQIPVFSAGIGAPTATGLTVNGATVFNETGADVDFRIESSGDANMFFLDGAGPRIYIRHNSSVNIGSAARAIQMHDTADGITNGIGIMQWAGANSSRGNLAFAKSLGSSIGSYTAVTDGRPLGAIEWYGANGSAFGLAAQIQAEAAETFSGTACGGEMTFHTVDIGSTTLDERMRIKQNGFIGIGTSVPEHTMDIGGENAIAVRAQGVNDVSLLFQAKHPSAGWQHYGTGHVSKISQYDTGLNIAVAGSAAANASITWIDAMTIKSDSKVGIGTTAPLGKVHIWSASGGGAVTYNAVVDELLLENDADCGMTIMSGAAHNGQIWFGTTGDHGQGRINYDQNDSSMRLYSSNAEKFTLLSSEVVVNETGANVDFRVESDDNPYAFFLNAGNNKIGMGGSGADGMLTIYHATSSWTWASTSSGTAAHYTSEWRMTGSSPSDTTSVFLNCNSGALKLRITSDGTVTNATGTYTQVSDVRIKQDIEDAGSQWEDIKAIKVRKFRMKYDIYKHGEADAIEQIGVVAQEAENVSPGLIAEIAPDEYSMEHCGFGEQNEDGEWVPKQVGGKDMTVKIFKQSILYMKSVKALQEAMAKIETLETKVTALENA